MVARRGRYQKFEGEYRFATKTMASIESSEVGKTEKVTAGKCSRAWMERDLRREVLYDVKREIVK